MKKQAEGKISLKKLTIAKISRDMMSTIKGGDCLPTEEGWTTHESDIFCNGGHTP